MRAKTMVRPRPGVCRILARTLTRSRRWDWKTICVVVAWVAWDEELSARTRTGRCMKLRVRATIGPGIVAEKSMV